MTKRRRLKPAAPPPPAGITACRPGTSCIATLPAGYDQRTACVPIDMPRFSGILCSHPERPPLIVDSTGNVKEIRPDQAAKALERDEIYFRRRSRA